MQTWRLGVQRSTLASALRGSRELTDSLALLEGSLTLDDIINIMSSLHHN